MVVRHFVKEFLLKKGFCAADGIHSIVAYIIVVAYQVFLASFC